MPKLRRLLMTTLLCSSTAFAGPIVREHFDRLWGKYAVGFFEKPKMGCVCFDGTNNYRLGSLVKFGRNGACYLPGFDADGVLMTQSPCNGPFSPLTK